jgi:hypothetical protein
MTEPKPHYHAGRTEHDEHAAFVAWARLQSSVYPGLDLLHSIPNGFQLPRELPGYRRARIVQYMKEEGLLPGVPDLFLPVPRGVFHGLYIEFKVGSNKPEGEQLRIIGRLEANGYWAVVVWSCEEAIAIVEQYYSLPGAPIA